MRECKKCSQKKLLKNFAKDKRCKGGYCWICKSCRNEYLRNWKTENHEKVLEQKREYYQKHKIEVAERARKYHNTERGRQLMRVRRRNRKHKKRAHGGGINLQQWNEILEIYNHRCAYCGIHEVVLNILFGQKLTMDCVIPLSKGGKYSIENIVPACMECNCKKGTKIDWGNEVESDVKLDVDIHRHGSNGDKL